MEENNEKNLNEELASIKTNIENMQNNLNREYEEQLKKEEEPTDPEFSSDLEKDVKKPNKKGNGPLVLILLVVIVALGAFAYFYFSGNQTSKNSGGTEIKPTVKKSEYEMSGNSLEDFDLYFLKTENERINKVYSPLSIKYVLEMLAEGAGGDSKAQLDSVIGKYEARKYTNSSNMSFANALFINESVKDTIKADYANKLLTKYNAEVKYDSFANANNINNWIKEKTLNIIPKALDNVDDSTTFMLVNALAIDMEWQNKFLDYINGMMDYSHEKIKENESGIYVNWMIMPEISTLDFENMNKKVSAMEIQASFNRYDIISELGEESIRKTVSDEFKKHMKENPNMYCYESELCSGREYQDLTDSEKEAVIKNYLDGYIEEIAKNYNKSGYSTDFLLYTDDSVKVFAKDLKTYNGTTLQYVGIMPTSVSLDSYVNSLTAEELNKILGNLKELKLESFKDGVLTRIEGYIPKFEFDYTLQLKADLKKLGIVNVFDSNLADLSNLTTQKGSYIDKAEHKARIEFTQDGIKAAAVTEVGGAGAGAMFDYLFEIPSEVIDLTFNKPYMFIVRDKSTGEVWFTGTVYTPLLYDDDKTVERWD